MCLRVMSMCERFKKELGLIFHPLNGPECLCVSVCLCIYSSEWVCPLTGCVCRGPSTPAGGGLGAAVTLPRARHAMCS